MRKRSRSSVGQRGVEKTVGYIREVLGQEPYPQTALALLCGLAELREPSLGMEVRRYGGGPLQEGVHPGAGPEFGDRASADAGGERVRRERRRMGNMRSGRSRRSRRRCRRRDCTKRWGGEGRRRMDRRKLELHYMTRLAFSWY